MITVSLNIVNKEWSLEELRQFSENGRKIFIYGNGGAGRWFWKALEELGVKIESFIDTDVKKLTVNFGFHTINLAEGEEKITSKDLLIIGAVDIHEILTI